jgi:uncharacterized membrane protein
LIIIFIFLYRIVKRFLIGLFTSSSQNDHTSNSKRQRKKYGNIEEAKFTDISDKDEKEKNP